MERNPEGMKTKGTIILYIFLTITTNCSYYCSHSLHQYCDSYRGPSGPATANPIIVLMAIINHHHGNRAQPPLFFSSVNCESPAVHPNQAGAASVCATSDPSEPTGKRGLQVGQRLQTVKAVKSLVLAGGQKNELAVHSYCTHFS